MRTGAGVDFAVVAAVGLLQVCFFPIDNCIESKSVKGKLTGVCVCDRYSVC